MLTVRTISAGASSAIVTVLDTGLPDTGLADAQTVWTRTVHFPADEGVTSQVARRRIAAAEAEARSYIHGADMTPVGIAEIADRLGVNRQTADNWRTRGVLPDPRWTVGGRPAWAWYSIQSWAHATGRGGAENA